MVVALLAAAVVAHADTPGSWLPGPNAVLDNTYVGFVDQPGTNANVPTGSFNVSGWFFDTTAQGWAGADDIELWLGTMDGGGHLLTKLSFAQNRPDVAAATGNPSSANSGFGGVVPAGALTPGPQTLTVYAHTPAKGWWYQQVQVNVSASAATTAAPTTTTTAGGSGLPVIAIERPKDGENVQTNNPFDALGYALDPHSPQGCGVDRVSVYIGDRDNGGTYLGDASLGASDTTPVAQYGGQFDSCGWRLTWYPTQFHANTYLMYAYAHSAISGKEDNVVRYFAIREPT
jgi:hypothetical protein